MGTKGCMGDFNFVSARKNQPSPYRFTQANKKLLTGLSTSQECDLTVRYHRLVHRLVVMSQCSKFVTSQRCHCDVTCMSHMDLIV